MGLSRKSLKLDLYRLLNELRWSRREHTAIWFWATVYAFSARKTVS